MPVELPVPELDGVCAAVEEDDREVLPVFEGDTPAVSVAVGLAEGVVLVLRVLLEVGEAVPVPETVGVPVEVPVGVEAAVALPENELLPVAEALAPTLSEAVGDELLEEVPEGVGEELKVGLVVGVLVALGVPVPLALAVGVAEPDAATGMGLLGSELTEAEADCENRPLGTAEREKGALILAEAEAEYGAEWSAVCVGVVEAVAVPILGEKDGLAVCVGSLEAAEDSEAEAVTETEGVALVDL